MEDEIKIVISETKRIELEKAGEFTLCDDHLNQLIDELNNYRLEFKSEVEVRSSQKMNKRLDRIEKRLIGLLADCTDLVAQFDNPDKGYDRVVATNEEIIIESAGIDARKFLSDLDSLVLHLKELRLARSSGGRPKFLWLENFLTNVASIYIGAGGRSTEVKKSAVNGRKSAFISFVWIALQLLPREARPASRGALAAFWEKRRRASRASLNER